MHTPAHLTVGRGFLLSIAFDASSVSLRAWARGRARGAMQDGTGFSGEGFGAFLEIWAIQGISNASKWAARFGTVWGTIRFPDGSLEPLRKDDEQPNRPVERRYPCFG